MPNFAYKVNTGAILSSEMLLEATKEELRILAYIIAKGGIVPDTKKVAADCKVSAARASSAIALWSSVGVLEKKDVDTDISEIAYEFDDRITDDFIDMTTKDVAAEIRKGNLREVMEEIAELVGKPTLNEGEVRIVTNLHAQLGLSVEYIRILANYLASTMQRFTVFRLKDRAKKLSDDNITDVELLEKYIEDTTSRSQNEYEFKNLFGGDIWGRNLTTSEKKYLKRWWGEFGYSAAIIEVARDLAIQRTTKADLKYMDTCLTAWHEAGCKTVDEVEAYRETAAITAKVADGQTPKRGRVAAKKQETTDTPLFGDFTTEDALMRALERSYGTEDKS